MTGISDAELQAVLLSAKVSTLAVLLVLPFAIAAGWLLARKQFFAKPLVEAIVTLPLVLPPVVTGYLLLVALGSSGFLGAPLRRLGVSLSFSWAGAALAAAVVSFPLAVRAIRQSIEAIDPRYEIVARTLGAGAWRRFVTITLPLAGPGILTGAVLAFARSLGEFGATITFVGNIPGETRTLPLAIFSAAQRPDGEVQGARLVAISVFVALLALIASEYLARRRP